MPFNNHVEYLNSSLFNPPEFHFSFRIDFYLFQCLFISAEAVNFLQEVLAAALLVWLALIVWLALLASEVWA